MVQTTGDYFLLWKDTQWSRSLDGIPENDILCTTLKLIIINRLNRSSFYITAGSLVPLATYKEFGFYTNFRQTGTDLLQSVHVKC